MSETGELRDALAGARIVIKGQMRSLRSLLGYLADLERRLEGLEDAEPQEAGREHTEHSRNDNGRRLAAGTYTGAH